VFSSGRGECRHLFFIHLISQYRHEVDREVPQDISLYGKQSFVVNTLSHHLNATYQWHVPRHCYSAGSEAVATGSSDGAFSPALSSAVEIMAESMS